MRKAIITAALVLAGCTTVEDIQSGPAVLDVTTAKGGAEIAQCFSERYANRPWRVTPMPLASGRILSLQMESNTVRPVIAVIEIAESSGLRHVVVRARGADREHVSASVRSCLT
jgi:hypothetical protein